MGNSKRATQISSPMELDDIEEIIDNAIRKVGGDGENDLCKYIPAETGEGYMHHFTLRKMKLKDPFQLVQLIDQYVIQAQHPTPLDPKQRAPRGSRKRGAQYIFTNDQLKDLILWAKNSGNEQLVSALKPRKKLNDIKKDLITSIKQNEIRPELWQAYSETLQIEIQLQKTQEASS
ncbi:MAG: hypothetical protein A3F09_05515 [Chlamydiae bacterium RIFCSPHIGHO2_12_FULL_49_11]|nr:MAG: hypothetical protein A3F09_05515 [Chlamydiae bacterium RIFCSPHIGHO2_12_FULL_49_11]